jgi:acid phosphatase family membrane protein YuiD
MSIVLLVSVCAWVIAQLLKVFIALIRKKQIDLRLFFSSGGMPSAHSATVSALAASVAIVEGFSSATFGIAAIFAMVVMYDAAGVRQWVGRQSIVLNRIVKEIRFRRPVAELERDLREFIGHTQFQVVIGSVLGIGIAWIWFTISGM